MSKRKIKGWFIKDIKQINDREVVVSLKDGRQLLLRAEPDDWGYSARINVSKIDN